jgi:transcription elongation GreA/GreB family factor
MQVYSFLQRDYDELLRRKEALEQQLREMSKQLGSDRYGWGDPASGDEPPDLAAEQGYQVVVIQLQELVNILRHPRVVNPPTTIERVCLGTTVIVEEDGCQKKFTIGSYRIYDARDNEIPYSCPLAQALIGAEEGDIRPYPKDGRAERVFRIVAIKPYHQ